MFRKCLITCFLSMGALALVSGTAAAQTGGDGGHFGPDNCYYFPYHGQWVRKGCQWTQDGHTLFRNDLEAGALYVLVQTAYGPQWMRGDQYLAQLQAMQARQAQQGRQDWYVDPTTGQVVVGVGPPDDGLPPQFQGALDNIPGTNAWSR